MIKKSILSALGGVVLALTLSMGTSARAQDSGIPCTDLGCKDRIGCYYIAGCIIYWRDCGPGCAYVTEIQCQYIEGPCGGDPNIAE